MPRSKETKKVTTGSNKVNKLTNQELLDLWYRDIHRYPKFTEWLDKKFPKKK